MRGSSVCTWIFIHGYAWYNPKFLSFLGYKLNLNVWSFQILKCLRQRHDMNMFQFAEWLCCVWGRCCLVAGGVASCGRTRLTQGAAATGATGKTTMTSSRSLSLSLFLSLSLSLSHTHTHTHVRTHKSGQWKSFFPWKCCLFSKFPMLFFFQDSHL